MPGGRFPGRRPSRALWPACMHATWMPGCWTWAQGQVRTCTHGARAHCHRPLHRAAISSSMNSFLAHQLAILCHSSAEPCTLMTSHGHSACPAHSPPQQPHGCGAYAGLHSLLAWRAGAEHITAVERWLYLSLACNKASASVQRLLAHSPYLMAGRCICPPVRCDASRIHAA